eukprot:363761-Chlamydomonas_euryale.AAC.36
MVCGASPKACKSPYPPTSIHPSRPKAHAHTRLDVARPAAAQTCATQPLGRAHATHPPGRAHATHPPGRAHATWRDPPPACASCSSSCSESYASDKS